MSLLINCKCNECKKLLSCGDYISCKECNDNLLKENDKLTNKINELEEKLKKLEEAK